MAQAQTAMTLAELQALANEAAEEGPDMNEAVAGGGGARLLPEGYTLARLVEIIETGNHVKEFNGKPKPPAPQIRFGFELYSPGFANDDGTPYVIRTYDISISRNEKAGAYKLFKLLNWKGTAKSFGQLIGQAFLVPIVNKPKSKTDTTLRSKIDLDKILPPLDALTRQPYPLPDLAMDNVKLFLWDRPTLAAWDALFIDGTMDDGRSKNYIQELCLSATDFPGSPLEQLLLTNNVKYAIPVKQAKQADTPTSVPGAALPPMTPPVAAAAPVVAPVAAPAVAVAVAPPVAPVVQAAAPVVAPVIAPPALPAV